jgi:hypothetical protein
MDLIYLDYLLTKTARSFSVHTVCLTPDRELETVYALGE